MNLMTSQCEVFAIALVITFATTTTAITAAEKGNDGGGSPLTHLPSLWCLL